MRAMRTRMLVVVDRERRRRTGWGEQSRYEGKGWNDNDNYETGMKERVLSTAR